MKVRCLVVKEVDEKVRCANPDCENCVHMRVWDCVDQAPGATVDSLFHYEVTDCEDEQFGGVVEGKFVELIIEEIARGRDGVVRMMGRVSKFACDYNARGSWSNGKPSVSGEEL
jgi:hypothetical protein